VIDCRMLPSLCTVVATNKRALVTAWRNAPNRCAAGPLNTSAPVADCRKPPRFCVIVPAADQTGGSAAAT
jgi:hypothetical protein